ncbi:MAG: hypothetical protein AAF654_10935 [Myxococcota bacterium]
MENLIPNSSTPDPGQGPATELETPPWFGAMIERLLLGYPSQKLKTGQVEHYWKWVGKFSHKAVAQGFRNAAEQSPEFFPSASRVYTECQQVVRRLEMKAKTRAALNPEKELSGRKSPAEDNRAPKTPQAQMAYVGEAGDPFEKTARLWECENNNNRTMDGETLPPMRDLNDRRAKELNRLIAKHWPDRSVK